MKQTTLNENSEVRESKRSTIKQSKDKVKESSKDAKKEDKPALNFYNQSDAEASNENPLVKDNDLDGVNDSEEIIYTQKETPNQTKSQKFNNTGDHHDEIAQTTVTSNSRK